MRHIVKQCPAFQEIKAKLIGGEVVPERMDFCSKTKQPCIKVNCPMKQAINKLKEIRRVSSEYNTQYELQQLITFFEIEDIPE